LLSELDFCPVLFSAVTRTAPTTATFAALPMNACTVSLSVVCVLVLVTPISAPAEPVAVACAS